MNILVFSAALASAFLNACWNVVAKKAGCPSAVLPGIVIVSAILCLFISPMVGLPPKTAWTWIIAGSATNVLFLRLLTIAYERAKFAIAYAAVRGVVSPAMYVIGWGVFNEETHFAGLAGLVLVMCGVLVFSATTSRVNELSGVTYSLFAGVALAAVLTVDIIGVRVIGTDLTAITQYSVWSSIGTGLLSLAALRSGSRAPLLLLAQHGRMCCLGAIFLIGSYALGLWAFAQGPVALVSPLREMSLIFGGIIAWKVLGERMSARQWSGVGLATCGALLIRGFG